MCLFQTRHIHGVTHGGPLCLASLTEHHVSKQGPSTLQRVSVLPSLSWLSSVPLCGYFQCSSPSSLRVDQSPQAGTEGTGVDIVHRQLSWRLPPAGPVSPDCDLIGTHLLPDSQPVPTLHNTLGISPLPSPQPLLWARPCSLPRAPSFLEQPRELFKPPNHTIPVPA